MGIALFLASTALAACTTDDTAPPPPELLGTWRYIPKPSLGDVPIDERQVVAFTADGRYESRSTHGDQTGDFAVDDRALTIDPGGDGWITTSFLVTPDRLLVDALFPVGAVDGTIGQWSGTQSAQAGASTVTLSLAADGRARLDQAGPASETLIGGWTHVGDEVVFTYHTTSGVPIDKHYQEVVGAAVGEWLYERVE
jgi:hypothetical protein